MDLRQFTRGSTCERSTFIIGGPSSISQITRFCVDGSQHTQRMISIRTHVQPCGTYLGDGGWEALCTEKGKGIHQKMSLIRVQFNVDFTASKSTIEKVLKDIMSQSNGKYKLNDGETGVSANSSNRIITFSRILGEFSSIFP